MPDSSDAHAKAAQFRAEQRAAAAASAPPLEVEPEKAAQAAGSWAKFVNPVKIFEAGKANLTGPGSTPIIKARTVIGGIGMAKTGYDLIADTYTKLAGPADKSAEIGLGTLVFDVAKFAGATALTVMGAEKRGFGAQVP